MTLKEIVHSDPEILSPSVSREQAVAFLEEAGKAALALIA